MTADLLFDPSQRVDNTRLYVWTCGHTAACTCAECFQRVNVAYFQLQAETAHLRPELATKEEDINRLQSLVESLQKQIERMTKRSLNEPLPHWRHKVQPGGGKAP